MAQQFLEVPGTNGFLVAPVTMMTTELNGLTNGSAATSSVGGSSGAFTQTTFSNAIKLAGLFNSGGAFTPTAGGLLAGWWLKYDGSNYETLVSTPSATVPALPRPPDFLIPFDVAALASGNNKWIQGDPRWPYVQAKMVVQNLCGVTLPSASNIIKIGAVADQAA